MSSAAVEATDPVVGQLEQKHLLSDMLPATMVGLFVACSSCCIFGTVGGWMPYYLSTEKGWSTQEYSAFYVCWGIVCFFGLWLEGWLADRIGRRVGFSRC